MMEIKDVLLYFGIELGSITMVVLSLVVNFSLFAYY